MSWWRKWIENIQRGLCVIVGHGDYAAYQRVCARQGLAAPLDASSFLRQRQEARYADGRVKRCPC